MKVIFNTKNVEGIGVSTFLELTLGTYFFWFNFIAFSRNLKMCLRLLFIVFFLMFIFYGFFYILYYIPHFFRDWTSEYISEDVGENPTMLDENDYQNALADYMIIQFWEYYVFHSFANDWWRGLYYEDDGEEEWDWLHKRGLGSETYFRKQARFAAYWYWNDWDDISLVWPVEWWNDDEIMAMTSEHIPTPWPWDPEATEVFDEFHRDEAYAYLRKNKRKFMRVFGEGFSGRQNPGTYQASLIEDYNWYRKWWLAGRTLARYTGHERSFPSMFDNRLKDVQMTGPNIFSPEEHDGELSELVKFIRGCEDINDLPGLLELESLIIDEENWEYSDD